MTARQPITAVIPAAGFAKRLGDTIDGSKEVVDVGGVPAAAHLLRRLAASEITRGVIALRRGKWDVPNALRGDHLHGVDLAYVMVDETPSVVHSLAPALRLAAGDVIALAFPDVIYEPPDALRALAHRQRAVGADVVLGLFETDAPERVDMVRLDRSGRPVDIVIKQPDQGLRYSWTLALWAPSFTRFLLGYLEDLDAGPAAEQPELQIGEVVQSAIRRGLDVAAEIVDGGSYVDVGTPAGLERARRLRFT